MLTRNHSSRAVVAVAAFCSVAILAPRPAAAKAPAPDWAVTASKTPTPTNVGNAPAVVLFDETVVTVDAQSHAVERERTAVRILKPQGRKYGTCEAAYDVDSKLNYIHSWTILADGKQFQAMETDFTDYGAYDSAVLQMTERIRAAKTPASDPGAVIICESETQLRPYMSEERWEIQQSIPVVYQAFELDLPPGGHYADSWHRFAPVKPTETASNHLRWEVKDMPALDLENIHATPNWAALAARVSIQWGDAAVKGNENQWRAIGLWESGLEVHRPDPTPEITAKTQALIAGAPDLYTKLDRITSYILNNVRYFIVERGIGGWQPHFAGDIFRNRYGDCKDKTTLLIAMLQAAGITAHSLSVDHRRGFVDPAAPSRFGDHMITAIELPPENSDPRLAARVKTTQGKTLLIFDPTDEKTPVGLIDTRLQGGWGYLADGANSQVIQMPVLAPDTSGRTRNGAFTLANDGSISGNATVTYSGVDASDERWFIKENDSRETREDLERGFGIDLPGLALGAFQFHQTDELNQPLDLTIQLSAAGYAHPAGPLLLLRPRVFGTHAVAVPDLMEGKPRTYPIELGHPGHWHDAFDITIPAGYVVDETPDPASIDLDFASYHSTVSAKGNLLHYERDYIVRQVELPPDQALAFRKLESVIVTDERGTAVLKKQ